jgi:hypothetical protein
MGDDDIETYARRRQGGIGPEKFVAVLISGASLAFVIFSAALGAYDSFQRDVAAFNTRVVALDGQLAAIGASHTVWSERILELERELGAVRDRANFLSERVVRCEGRAGVGP